MTDAGDPLERVGAALFLALLGAAFAIKALDYGVGSSQQPGPGYFPLLLSILLIGLAGVIGLREFWVRKKLPTLDRWPIRQLLGVIGSLLLFIALISGWGIPGFQGTGLVLAVFLLLVIVGALSQEMRLRENLVLASLLTLAALVVFVYLFGLTIPLWPWSY